MARAAAEASEVMALEKVGWARAVAAAVAALTVEARQEGGAREGRPRKIGPPTPP